MTMNAFLGQAYGTAAPSIDDDQEKLAEAGMFAKLAAENGIDLNAYTDEQVQELYTAFQAKIAADGEHGHKHGDKAPPPAPEKKDDGDKEAQAKVAAAKAEFDLTKEAQAKVAEADMMGRIMAHSFAQELGYIREEAEKTAAAAASKEGTEKEAGAMVHVPDKGKWVKPGLASKAKALFEKHKGKASFGAGAATGAAAGAAAAHGGKDGKKKKASAQDEVAAELALYKAAEAGFDPEEVGGKLDALFTLGLPADEQSKVASAANFEQGMEIRALELLEMVGLPVNWG